MPDEWMNEEHCMPASREWCIALSRAILARICMWNWIAKHTRIQEEELANGGLNLNPVTQLEPVAWKDTNNTHWSHKRITCDRWDQLQCTVLLNDVIVIALNWKFNFNRSELYVIIGRKFYPRYRCFCVWTIFRCIDEEYSCVSPTGDCCFCGLVYVFILVSWQSGTRFKSKASRRLTITAKPIKSCWFGADVFNSQPRCY